MKSTTVETSVGSCILKRSWRRTLAISVLPDGTVEVIAPMDATVPKIREKIEKRSGWIACQRRHFSTLNSKPAARRYCTGATHRYLGRQYRLKVVKADIQEVKLRGAYLCISSKSISEKSVAELVDEWFRKRAREQFALRLRKWNNWCQASGFPPPSVRLLVMPKRWGSSNKNGRIALNPELIRAPSVCVDYVIAHEMCHFKNPHHDGAFYAELEKLFPNWKNVKQMLESFEL